MGACGPVVRSLTSTDLKIPTPDVHLDSELHIRCQQGRVPMSLINKVEVQTFTGGLVYVIGRRPVHSSAAFRAFTIGDHLRVSLCSSKYAGLVEGLR